jgi:hypothetical protein
MFDILGGFQICSKIQKLEADISFKDGLNEFLISREANNRLNQNLYKLLKNL